MILSTANVPPEIRIEQAKGLDMMMLVLNALTSFRHDGHTGILSPLTQLITNPVTIKVCEICMKLTQASVITIMLFVACGSFFFFFLLHIIYYFTFTSSASRYYHTLFTSVFSILLKEKRSSFFFVLF